MTIRKLIANLLEYPNLDAQVVDTDGSPIMFTLYHNPNGGAKVRLGPKSQIDISAELEAFLEQESETSNSDRDTCDALKEMGYTLEDLRNYREDTYQWALQYWD